MSSVSVRLDQELLERANPDLPYEFVRQAIIAKAEKEAGKLETYDFG